MAREVIKFDGWELTEGTARHWESREGSDEVAGMTGQNFTIANRDGEVWTPKNLGPGRFTVHLWLAGNSIQQAQDAWRTLLRAVHRPHRLVRIERTFASGETVYAEAEVIGQISPTHLGQHAYRASITFGIPNGHWMSNILYEHSTTAGSGTPQTLMLTDFAPSTAPLTGLGYTIYGPITNPKLVDNTDGGTADQVTYAGTIPNGAWIQYNAGIWTITSGGGWSHNLALVNPTGRRFMTITSARPGDVPSVQMQGSSIGASTRLRVFGRRYYL